MLINVVVQIIFYGMLLIFSNIEQYCKTRDIITWWKSVVSSVLCGCV